MTALQGTTTGDKNEILWQHKVNYQTLPEQFKKVTKHLPLHALALCKLFILPMICVPGQGGSMHDED